MLARLSRELPDDGFLYEPKWDGFRCMVFRSVGEIDLTFLPDDVLARVRLLGDCLAEALPKKWP
jgi:hypothetical protein